MPTARRGLTVRDVVTSKGDGHSNEDFFGWLPSTAWVLDGASGIDQKMINGETAPRWFVQSFSAALADTLLKRPGLSTLDLINHAIRQCRDQWNALSQSDAAMPIATLAMLRVIDEQIELTSVGDCSIRYDDQAQNTQVFVDRSIEPFEQRTLRDLKSLQDSNPQTAHSVLKAKLKQRRRENRRFLNVAGGYNALSLSGVSQSNLTTTKIALFPGQEFLLSTDGLSRYSDVLELGDDRDLLRKTGSRPLNDILSEIRFAEEADPHCRRFLRVKTHDDVTGIIVRPQAA